jgi:hypothetical protein
LRPNEIGGICQGQASAQGVAVIGHWTVLLF